MVRAQRASRAKLMGASKSRLPRADWNQRRFSEKPRSFLNGIEDRARTLPDYSEKQEFLIHALRTLSFRATRPKPPIRWASFTRRNRLSIGMCASVERTLQTQWGKTLATPDVKILDPCTGTGNFVVNLMGRILARRNLPAKYENDLWANEIMLLPYYVASGNIEHTYFEKMGVHAAFEGVVLSRHARPQPRRPTGNVRRGKQRTHRAPEGRLTVIIGNSALQRRPAKRKR